MKITFAGANREVTGSCYHIETSHGNIMIDCGMFQGTKWAEDKNAEAFPFDVNAVQAIVITHAHFDHIGRLPKLYKDGFRGKMYGTAPTTELAMINLRDAVHLVEDEAERHKHEPLFTIEHVEPLQDMWQSVPYHQEFEVIPGVTAFLADAGHILGSACIKIMADGESAVFSGDLGNTPVPLLRAAECLTGADLVIVESTYGNRVHEASEQRYGFIRDAILDVVKNKGTLMIPAFALERTQELLFELNKLHSTHQIPNIPMFLDSPLAIAATEVFKHHPDYFNQEATNELNRDGELFEFNGLKYTQTADESRAILRVPGPKVIIAGSGMMNGGRIMHHLKNYLEDPKSELIIVGYQVEGSLGRRLHDGEKDVHIYGQEVHVKASVKSCGAFSGHADYPRLMHWLNCFQNEPPAKVCVTHGEIKSAFSLAQSVQTEMNLTADVPEFGSSVDISELLHARKTAPQQ
jgi:metallo-beta-lactamase family protein